MQGMPQFQTQQQLGSQSAGLSGHFQTNSMSGAGSGGGAFDQNTYMQLLQRQSSLNRSGMARPQSRGRPGGENIFQGQPQQQQNQTLNFGDSSLLLSPNSNQNHLGSKLGLAAGPPQNCNGPPNLSKINGINWSDMSSQYGPQPQFQQQPMPASSGNHRSNSQTGAGSSAQSFLNQTQSSQYDLMQQHQLGMYRNTSQP